MTTYTIKRIKATSCSKHDSNFGFIAWVDSLPNSVSEFILSHRWVDRSIAEAYSLCPFGYRFTDRPAPVPQESYSELVLQSLKPKNLQWKKRMYNNEVVVSEMHVDRMKIRSQQGFSFGNDTIVWRNATHDELPRTRFQIVTRPETSTTYLRDGSFYYRLTWQNEYTSVVNFYDNVVPVDLLKQITNPACVESNPVLLQKVVSNANKRSVDVLTALAEAPETIAMVVSAVKNVIKLLSDFKSRKIALEKEYQRLKDNLIKAYLDELDVLAQRSARDKNKAKRYNQMVQRARRRHAKDLLSLSNDLASNIANAWMTYRYGIMPNVYLVNDIAKANKNLGHVRVTEHDKVDTYSDLPVVPGYSVTGSSQMRTRAWCQLSLQADYSPFGQLRTVGSFNILVTAWELVTLSWVVDWVLTVGNFLSAISPPSNQIDRGVTEAFRWSSSLVLTDSFTNQKMYVERDSYQRFVKSTADFAGIHLNVDMNWRRYADSAALFWQRIGRSQLSKLRSSL